MNIKEYISSGILETYCMGTLSSAEAVQVEQFALQHPEIRREIEQISSMLETYAMQAAVEVPKNNKQKLFRQLYKMDAGPGHPFPPLIEQGTSFESILEWVKAQSIVAPVDYEEVHLHDLPGDEFVTNFLAWVKNGHPDEIHQDYYEYIVVLQGSCKMIYQNETVDYKAGDIIAIPLHAPHEAIITSAEPMFAMVQRQMVP